MMEYKGYLGQVQFDDETDIFHGEVINIRDVITFQGRSVEELRQALKDSVDDYLDFCVELRKEPEKPFSGRVTIRLSPEQHRKVILAASQAGEALERWIAETLDRATGTIQLGAAPV